MNTNHHIPKAIHFVGVGGIGMSAIARYYNAMGVSVTGYDKTETVLTKQLVAEGISIHYVDELSLAPTAVDFVVYTPAIPANHTQLNFYKNNNYTVYKRSDVLQLITANAYSICVAGTHGKTTTSSILAHLLRDTQYGCNAFLGGIAANYNTNFWSSSNNAVVVEADEYDRSFLKLSPDVAIITAVDPDHLDIYGTPEEVVNAFVQFSQRIKPTGCLVAKYGLSCHNRFTASNIITYDLNNTNADVHISNLQVIQGAYEFSVISKQWQLHQVKLTMGGLHNIENALAAITVCKYLNIDDEKIKAALAKFKGVKRRFERILPDEQLTTSSTLIDDYAHHPEELRALINGVRSIYKNEKLTLVFQPHLFSRTNDLADGFAEALDMADETIVLPIYPARELPMPGVTSELILNKMTLANKQMLEKEEMLQYVEQHRPALLVMAGAGDIDVLVYKAKDILSK